MTVVIHCSHGQFIYLFVQSLKHSINPFTYQFIPLHRFNNSPMHTFICLSIKTLAFIHLLNKWVHHFTYSFMHCTIFMCCVCRSSSCLASRVQPWLSSVTKLPVILLLRICRLLNCLVLKWTLGECNALPIQQN